MSGEAEFRVRVAETETVADGIRRLRLVPLGRNALPLFSGGAHTVLTMHDEDRVLRNPYSLMGSPFDPSSYQISVLRTPNSRGGSIFVHDKLREGSELSITAPVNLFPIDRRARRHVLIAGGIGITPFMAMMEQLEREELPFELHYGMRSKSGGAYWSALRDTYGRRINTYFDDAQQKIPLTRLLENQPLGTHLYVCGPAAMIDWVLSEARDAGWPEENVHFERFSAPPAGAPFTIELAKAGRTIDVKPTQSILEAIEAAGLTVPFLCRGGACGQCETHVVSCSGAIEHNDHFLSAAEKASGGKIMICVSRLKSAGSRIVLDL
jgi:ferredoxin-NADP reductase